MIDVDVDGTVLTTPVDLWQSLELNGGEGADTYYIKDQPPGLNLVARGGNGTDTFVMGNVTESSVFDYIQGNVAIFGGAGSDGVYLYDGKGASTEYTIQGIAQLEYDASIDASDYTAGKLFVVGEIEDLVLEANALSNSITLTGITAAMEVNVYAGQGGDGIVVSDVGSAVTVNVFGQAGADTLTVGEGDLGAVRAHVTFDGGGNSSDQLILDDTSAPAGRVFQLDGQSITGTNGFGGIASYALVEDLVLKGSSYDDDVSVEGLDSWVNLEVFGNQGDDVFFISGVAHDVAAIEGTVIIHGGDGSLPQHNMKLVTGEDDDQIYVYDEQTKQTGDFTFNLHGSAFRGRLNKFVGEEGFAPRATLNVVYDQVERTYLYADDGANAIDVNAAPWFNQLWLFAAGGDDQIDIESTPNGSAGMRVFGQAGADTVRVSPGLQNLNHLDSELIVDGGASIAGEQDTLLISDVLSGNTAPYQLSSGSVTRGGAQLISYALFDHLQLALSNADNEIDVVSTAPGTSTIVQGSQGADVLTASNLQSAVIFEGGNAQDRAVLLGTAASDTFTATGDTLTIGAGSLASDAETLAVDGLGGTDRLELWGVQSIDEMFGIFPSTTPNQGRVTRTSSASLNYANVEELFAAGNLAEGDSLLVNGSTDPAAIMGGAANDRFNIQLDAAGTSASPVLRLYQGKMTLLLTLVDFQNLGVPTIDGLLGADTFNVWVQPDTASASRQIRIDGGGEPGGSQIDRLKVFYSPAGAKAKQKPDEITIEYLDYFFAIYHEEVEAASLLPV